MDVCAILTCAEYASQNFVTVNPEVTLIMYPSCRDPKQRDNAAVLTIERLSKNPNWESTIRYFYDNQQQSISWIDYTFTLDGVKYADSLKVR